VSLQRGRNEHTKDRDMLGQHFSDVYMAADYFTCRPRPESWIIAPVRSEAWNRQ